MCWLSMREHPGPRPESRHDGPALPLYLNSSPRAPRQLRLSDRHTKFSLGSSFRAANVTKKGSSSSPGSTVSHGSPLAPKVVGGSQMQPTRGKLIHFETPTATPEVNRRERQPPFWCETPRAIPTATEHFASQLASASSSVTGALARRIAQ
jgi:hypothetical protein